MIDFPVPFRSWNDVELKQERTSTCIQRYNENENIILIQTYPGVLIDVPQAIENREAAFRLSPHRKVAMMITGGREITTTPAMRELCATAEYNSGVLAIALVSPLASMKIMGNFYLRINRPAVTTRFFTNADIARNWLLKEAAAYELAKVS